MRYVVGSMRVALALLTLVGLAAPAVAQQASAAPAAECARTDVAVAGGIGRASVVSFTGAVTGAKVCVLVVNLAGDAFSSSVGAASADDAVVSASVSAGQGAVLSARATGLGLVPSSGTAPSDGVPVGPFVVAPGGAFPSFGGDASEVPRVVLAYAGPRVVLMRTSAVSLLDLAHVLREQPELFGSDAPERAVVLSGGDSAALTVRTADGTILGRPVTASLSLRLMKRA
jgi:hypothetical protein